MYETLQTSEIKPSILSRVRLPHVALLCAMIVVAGAVGVSNYSAQGATAESDAQVASAALALKKPFTHAQISAQSAYVLDTTTGNVLYSKNADAPLALASVTKLMLAVVVAETLDKNDLVPISESALAQEGDSGLIAGEIWRMQDLLDFTLVISSNDGARALAEAAAPVIRAKYPQAPNDTPVAPTIWLMNEKAKELELTNSYFLSASGLDVSEQMASAYGSAHDVGLLMSYAVKNHLDSIVQTTQEELVVYSNDGTEHIAPNTNGALGDISGLIAGKTGFTDIAGGNLAIAFDASIGRPIVVVVLASSKEGRFSDASALVKASREALFAN